MAPPPPETGANKIRGGITSNKPSPISALLKGTSIGATKDPYSYDLKSKQAPSFRSKFILNKKKASKILMNRLISSSNLETQLEEILCIRRPKRDYKAWDMIKVWILWQFKSMIITKSLRKRKDDIHIILQYIMIEF